MMYIKVNETLYPADVYGHSSDIDWDNRESCHIVAQMNIADAMAVFADDVNWSVVTIDIIEDYEEDETTGEMVSIGTHTETETYDKSEFSVLGDIISHKNGTVTIKMGKPTAEELLEMLIGGIRE